MSIAPEQVQKLPIFAQTFLALFRERPSLRHAREELRGNDLWLVIPARDEAVGHLEILVDANEATVYVGAPHSLPFLLI